MQETFNFGHFIPISTVDWYGRSVSVLFFRGCQFRCPYCQNYAYLTGRDEMKIEKIKSLISKSGPFISALVFSGGEPTLQPDVLKSLARFAKSKSLAVGLQTNGYDADVIKDMLDEGILDKIFLDVKAPVDDPVLYGRVIGLDTRTGTKAAKYLAETLQTCLANGIEVEARTTVFRGLAGAKEVFRIGRYLDGLAANNLTYIIQQGLPENTLDLRETEVLNRKALLQMAESIGLQDLKDLRIRTKENGDERII